jgi:hypothetical protein
VRHLLVPYGFIVPEGDEWEKELWGMKLGAAVQSIRNRNAYKQYRPELEAMGFDYDSQLIKTSYGWDLVRRALQAYKGKHGHMRVPYKFRFINYDPSWPNVLWGIKLGYMVNRIRNANLYKERREELEEMGFDYGPQERAVG